jgi:Fe-S cluster assembly protein SufD
MTPFSTAYAGLSKLGEGDPAWVKELRDEAFRRFTATGLPTRKDEEWKYTSLRPLTESELAVGKPGQIELVRGGAQAGLTVMPLGEALARRGDELKKLFKTLSTLPDKAFGTIGDAFLSDGVFIEVQKNVQVLEPIEISHAATAGAVFPRVLVSLAEGAELQLVETYTSRAAAQTFVGQATDLVLAPNAKLRHVRIQTEGDKAIHISRGRAFLSQDSKLEAFNFAAGARLNRNDFDVALAGSGAEVHLDGLYMAKGEQHVDNHTTIDHRVPDASSSQLYKGVLGGKSRAVFNGKVFVRQDAQRTSAYQMNRNLLLSSEAEIDTKPELQIDADDVKCSHGAAVGQLDPDQIFYLESRGIDKARATALLSEAFAYEALLKIQDDELRGRLAKLARSFGG